ncbi:hypothetical protein HYC85_023946, partial [Camellia sinensis]
IVTATARLELEEVNLCVEFPPVIISQKANTIKKTCSKKEDHETQTSGGGRFAKVKFAQSTETGDSVAMKVLDRSTIFNRKIYKKSTAVLSLIRNIKREISIMKLVRHPNVVLHHRQLSEAESKRYFQQLIDGVNYCHIKGVYHRDLKPENLLLDSQGNLKISDFGLSALPGESASFEQLVGLLTMLHLRGYDGAMANVWSCGVILCVLMVGYLPFDKIDLTTLSSKA